jgi:hypothetical protein
MGLPRLERLTSISWVTAGRSAGAALPSGRRSAVRVGVGAEHGPDPGSRLPRSGPATASGSASSATGSATTVASSGSAPWRCTTRRTAPTSSPPPTSPRTSRPRPSRPSQNRRTALPGLAEEVRARRSRERRDRRDDPLRPWTGPASFGHFSREVPDSLHIRAYRCLFLRGEPARLSSKIPAKRRSRRAWPANDLANCHAEGRGFESLQPLPIAERDEPPMGGVFPPCFVWSTPGVWASGEISRTAFTSCRREE